MKLHHARIFFSIAGMTCLTLLAACGSGSGDGGPSGGGPTTQPPPPPDPVPPPPEFTIHGEVLSFDTGMIGNADVNMFVYTEGFGYSYWWANGRLQSDELGTFEAHVPESTVSIFAFKDGYVQPCGVRRSVTEDIKVRIEMQPVSALNSVNAPRPQLSAEPSVTGKVYERTPAGLQPLADVGLWAEEPLGIPFASTRSDLGGGFYMCQLPPESHIAFYKTGFKTQSVGPFDPTQPTVLEVILEREDE